MLQATGAEAALALVAGALATRTLTGSRPVAEQPKKVCQTSVRRGRLVPQGILDGCWSLHRAEQESSVGELGQVKRALLLNVFGCLFHVTQLFVWFILELHLSNNASGVPWPNCITPQMCIFLLFLKIFQLQQCSSYISSG